MKKYENPMLQVVSINSNDIVTASDPNILLGGTFSGATDGTAFSTAGRRFDEWDEGF